MPIIGDLNGIIPPKRVLHFKTVGQLIDYLEILGRDRCLILDDDGNTYALDSNHIGLWDENDVRSPVAFFVPRS